MNPESTRLRDLLGDPSLELPLPAGLTDAVRGRARRVRRQRRLGGAALAVAALAGAVTLGPRLVPDDGGRVAGLPQDPRAPLATSRVVEVAELNGAPVLVWWQKDRIWCSGVYRVTTRYSCAGPVTTGPGLGEVVPALTVDNRHVAAGTIGDDVTAVQIELADGTRLPTALVDGDGSFPARVWSAEVPRGATVVAYVALGSAGQVVARRPA